MTTIAGMFSGSGSTPKPKSEPIPTRDTAADAVAQAEEDRRRRLLIGAGTQMLSGPSGVTGELTGTRGAGGG
jgi:hypothetical protein